MNAEVMRSLPGSEIVLPGLADLEAGRDTAAAAAVAMASTRLRGAGVPVPEIPASGQPAAHHLYELLASDHGDAAHSRYNATVRRIVSFARAAERAGRG